MRFPSRPPAPALTPAQPDAPRPPAWRSLEWFVRANLMVGAIAVASALPWMGRVSPWRVALVGLAFLVGDTALFHIRFGHNQQSFTWAETAVVVGLVVVPSPWLRLAAPAGVAMAHLIRRRPLQKVGFNAAVAAIGVLLARACFLVIGRQGSARNDPRVWVALAVAGLAYWAWNGLAVSIAIARSQGLVWWPVYRKGLALSVLVAAGNTATGILLVVIAAVNPFALACVPAVCILLLIAYRGYIKAMRDRDTWQVLQEVSTDLLQVDEIELAHLVIEGCRRLFGAEFVELLVAGAEPADEIAVFRQSRGEPMAQTMGSPFVIAAPYWGRVIADREPFQVIARRAPGPQREELAALGLTSCAVLPLLSGRRCVGALRIGFEGEVALASRELQVFSTYANHVTSAVCNAQLFAEMRNLALHDPLTGLPNRTLLHDRLDLALARSRRSHSRLAVLFIDVDRFKVINDSLGHEAGDHVLKAVAARLVHYLRPGDTATRFGGDEFVVVCEDVVDQAEARRLGNRLVGVFEAPFLLPNGREAFVTASVGVALSESGSDDPSALLGHADAAVYQAKERGRACCEVFDDALSTQVVTRLEREGELRQAIHADELVLHYQPIVALADQRIVGSEALLRWRHPVLGELAPAEFVPLAEEAGLIVAIGAWALRRAISEAAAGHGLAVSVNLSPQQLEDAGLVDFVASLLSEYRVDPALITLEITETALVTDTATATVVLRQLRGLGVRIALDDFGTGYSSLSYLRTLPVDVLKIDRSFLSGLGRDQRDLAIVSSIVELAHALGISVVAEGVETACQVAAVHDAGCDLAQGYYFARPQPLAQTVALESLWPPPAAGLAGSLQDMPDMERERDAP